MARELWEQALVYNVNVGDEIMINTYGHPATIDEGQIDKYGGIALAGYQLHSHDTVFRRYNGPSPDVLMRALQIASKQVLLTTHAMMERKAMPPGEADVNQYANSCISKAEDEIAKEQTE